MKKLYVVLVSLTCLFVNCVNYDTYHNFNTSNLSSNVLELRYKTVNMETLIDTIVEPTMNLHLVRYFESGEEGRLSSEDILKFLNSLTILILFVWTIRL